MKNNFYVYGHYTKGNSLFYIGKGIGDRHKTSASRSKVWKDFTSKTEWYSVILFSGLTKGKAEEIEACLISTNKKILLNKVITREDKPSVSSIAHKFSINESSPTGLVWNSWNGAYRKSVRREGGDKAGTLKYRNNEPKGSEVIVNGYVYQVPHIIWYLNCGEEVSTNHVIDHIDGNPHNNSIVNLRKITHAENSRNRKIQSNNCSGISGVYFMNNGWGRDYVVATANRNQKYFSIHDLGYEGALQRAVSWRTKQIATLNTTGAGYTERHGK